MRLAKILEGRSYDAAIAGERHAAEALEELRAGDYLSLSLLHRFAILNVCLTIALGGELLRCGPAPAHVHQINLCISSARHTVEHQSLLPGGFQKQRVWTRHTICSVVRDAIQ